MKLNTATKILTSFFMFTTARNATPSNTNPPEETTDLMVYFPDGKFEEKLYAGSIKREEFSKETFHNWVLGLKTNTEDKYCDFMDSIIDQYVWMVIHQTMKPSPRNEEVLSFNKLIVEYLKFLQDKMFNNIERPFEDFDRYKEKIKDLVIKKIFYISKSQLTNIQDYSDCFGFIKEKYLANEKECPENFLIDFNELAIILYFDSYFIKKVAGFNEYEGYSLSLSGSKFQSEKKKLDVFPSSEKSDEILSIYMKGADICKLTNLLSLFLCSPPQILGVISYIDNFKEFLEKNKGDSFLNRVSDILNEKLSKIIPIAEKNIPENSHNKEVENNDFTEKNILFCLYLAKELKIDISEPNKEKLKEYFTNLQVKVDSLNEREYSGKEDIERIKKEMFPSWVLNVFYGKVSSEMEGFDLLRLTRLQLLIRKFIFLIIEDNEMILHYTPFLEEVLKSSGLKESIKVCEFIRRLIYEYVETSNKYIFFWNIFSARKQKMDEANNNDLYNKLIDKLNKFIEILVQKIEVEKKRLLEEESTENPKKN